MLSHLFVSSLSLYKVHRPALSYFVQPDFLALSNFSQVGLVYQSCLPSFTLCVCTAQKVSHSLWKGQHQCVSFPVLHDRDPRSTLHKQQKFIFPQLWRKQVQDQGVGRCCSFPRRMRETCPFSSLSCWCIVGSLWPSGRHPQALSSSVEWCSPWAKVSLVFFNKDTGHIGGETHFLPDNLTLV